MSRTKSHYIFSTYLFLTRSHRETSGIKSSTIHHDDSRDRGRYPAGAGPGIAPIREIPEINNDNRDARS